MEFIGRTSELERIQALAKAWGETKACFVEGDGGIGKTRLLQEVRSRVSEYVIEGDSHSKKITVAIVSEITHSDWFKQFMAGVHSTGEELGVRVISHPEGVSMSHHIDTLMYRSPVPDAIIVNLGGFQKVEEKIEEAIGAGIKVLTIDYFSDIKGVTTEVSQDDFEGARLSLDALAHDVNYHGQAVALWVEDFVPLQRRVKVLDVAKQLYPDITWIDAPPLRNVPQEEAIEKAKQYVLDLLETHPETTTIWATWDELAKGATHAVMELGRADITVHGFDLGQSDYDLMVRPKSPWKTTVATNPNEAGQVMMRLSVRAAIGDKGLRRRYTLPMSMFRAEELSEQMRGVFSWLALTREQSQIGWAESLERRKQMLTDDVEKKFFVSDIFDFDNPYFHSIENLGLSLTKQVDPSIHGQYIEKLKEIRNERSKVGREHIEVLQRQALDIVVEAINSQAHHTRFLILLDTAEKWEEEESQNALIYLLRRVRNVLFIIAGRNERGVVRLKEQIQQSGNNSRLEKPLELEGLEYKDSLLYLQKKQSRSNLVIRGDLLGKIIWLADGRPILMDLAVDYLSRNYPLPWLEEGTLESLKAEEGQEKQKNWKKEFEYKLVEHIRYLRQPLDELCQVLGHVYPVDAIMISKVLDVSLEKAEAILVEAREYSFIKTLPDEAGSLAISLHDEMRDLVTKYVLDEIDRDQSLRRDYSAAAVIGWEEKYNRQNDMLLGESQERAMAIEVVQRGLEICQYQLVKHALFANPQTGFAKWDDFFGRRIESRDKRNAQRFLEILTPEVYSHLTEESQFVADLNKVRFFQLADQIPEALRLLDQLLKRHHNNEVREASIYNQMGAIESQFGDLHKAQEYQEKCYHIVKKIDRPAIPYVVNQLGYVYRSLYKYESAIEYFQEGIDYLLDEQKGGINQELLASLFNNLGQVYGLKKETFLMRENCQHAIDIWERLNSFRDVGRAETAMGIVARDQNRFDDALRLLESAVARFDPQLDYTYLARSLLHLGWTEWFRAEVNDQAAEDIRGLRWNLKRLETARKKMEESLEIAEKRTIKPLLPAVYHQLSSVYWYLGRAKNDKMLRQKAREYNQKSLDLAKEVKDVRYVADAILGNAEWDYEEQIGDKILDYVTQLEQGDFNKDRFRLYSGRMQRIQGDLAFYAGDYKKAFQFYAVAMHEINADGGFAWYSIERELQRLENKMKNHLGLNDRKLWVDYLEQNWDRGGSDSLLLEWCRQQYQNIRVKELHRLQ